MMGQGETLTHLGLTGADNVSHSVQLGSYSKDFDFHSHLDLCENFILIDWDLYLYPELNSGQ
jgi:hypothetical protein